MAEKLSRKSNSSGVTTIPALIFHIHWGRKGGNLTAFPALRDILRPPPDFCVKLTFFFSLAQDGYVQKSVTASYTPLWVCLCVWETHRKIEYGGRKTEGGSECFHYLRVPLLILCTTDSFVCFTLYDLSVCWRLRVLSMKIKCVLWQLCPLRKTDGLLRHLTFGPRMRKSLCAHWITLCAVWIGWCRNLDHHSQQISLSLSVFFLTVTKLKEQSWIKSWDILRVILMKL